ncbi:autotransporter outer membrane beta-barrel domain-containing protein [[Ochrobactrum] teleogrylli]|uniref:Autotransporter outer membrane beta-barrel domain-containing protein n=1 Tax=Ochrobactrum teleogrylli TaxID=2479765 RepID=A0ABD5K2Y8_9HYPH
MPLCTVRQLDGGSLDIDGDGIGAYWTHIGPSGWYVDADGMYNWLDGEAVSNYGAGADLSGDSILLSLESGYPFALGGGWKLEPQAQIIWQRVDFDDTYDQYSSIDYDASNSWTGRLGLRLEADTTINEVPVQPFVDVNLWHNFSSSYATQFNDGSMTTKKALRLNWALVSPSSFLQMSALMVLCAIQPVWMEITNADLAAISACGSNGRLSG